MKHWRQVEYEWFRRIQQAFGVPYPLDAMRTLGHVPQHVLQELHDFARVLERAKKAFDRASAKYALHAEPVIAALRAGLDVERGAYLAALKKEERRTMSWRAEFEKLTSKKIADALLASVTPKVTYHVAVMKTKTKSRTRKVTRAAA